MVVFVSAAPFAINNHPCKPLSEVFSSSFSVAMKHRKPEKILKIKLRRNALRKKNKFRPRLGLPLGLVLFLPSRLCSEERLKPLESSRPQGEGTGGGGGAGKGA